jgi:hypothetical protein
MNLPALDHTVHQLNSRSPPSWDRAPPQGKESRLRLRLQGRQHMHIHQEVVLPGDSHAHCPQTRIPHMPVPPQESAPSLSPRQSFGCQSPLPWVIGTDRTGILGLYGSYRGSFQEFSSPSAHSLTWRSRFTGQQASRSPALRGHNNPCKTQTSAFQNGSAVIG